MLIGNKNDCKWEREVSTQEGRAFARELGCKFVEASAKDYQTVEGVFYDPVRILNDKGRRTGIWNSVRKVISRYICRM